MSDSQKKNGCGCCMGRGCGFLIIVAGIFAVLIGWCYHLGAGRLRHGHYTSSSSGAVPIENANADDYSAVLKRMEAFKHAAPGSNATLTLTSHDLNVLIAFSPQWAGVRGKINTRIEGSDVSLIGSIPLASIPELRDQYANGTLRFTSSIENKVLHVTIQDIKLKTHELSKAYMQLAIALLEPQLTNRLLGDPVIGAVLIKAETMKVENGALVLTRAAD